MKIDLLGIKIDNLRKKELLQAIESRLEQDRSIFIVTPYSESIVATQKDEEFRKILNSADFALPDGIGILWAAKFLSGFPSPGLGRDQGRGRILIILWQLIKSLGLIIFFPKSIRSPIPEKISGSDFVWDLAGLAEKNKYSVFLLGGFGNAPERVGERLREKFPNLKIAGVSNASPFVSPPREGELEGVMDNTVSHGTSPLSPPHEEGNSIIETINSSGADFLFVALGPIRQEKWIYENLPNLRVNPVTAPSDIDPEYRLKTESTPVRRSNGVKLAIGLGGTFDYIADKRPPAPQILRQAGLEWLWRLATQPSRIFRIARGVFGLIFYAFKKRLNSI